jgi:hypothetical protein
MPTPRRAPAPSERESSQLGGLMKAAKVVDAEAVGAPDPAEVMAAAAR